jgi:hypothetical protein
VPALGGVAEVADLFGVPRTTASMWANRRAQTGFPEPVQVLAMGPVYDMDAVRLWHAQRYPS